MKTIYQHAKNNQKNKIMKLSEKKELINDFISSKPEKQFSTGLFFVSVGTKYVHYYSIWGNTTSEKMDIDEFMSNYIKK